MGVLFIALAAVIALLVVLTLWTLISKPKWWDPRGKVAVVTGGSQGIGLEICKQLVQGGCSVAILARKPAVLETARKEIESVAAHGARVITIPTDVGDDAACVAAARQTFDTLDRIDAVVNVAGYSTPGEFHDLSAQQWEAMYRVNVIGTRNATAACLPYIKQQPFGRILFTSSLAGQAGICGFTAYSATKFALVGFAQALQMELCPDNIQVTVLFPPDTDTPGLKAEADGKPEACRIISEESGLFTAPQVAASALASLKAGSFSACNGFDGNAAAILTAGCAPTTPLGALVDAICVGPLRFLSFFYTLHYNSIVRKVRAAQEKAK